MHPTEDSPDTEQRILALLESLNTRMERLERRVDAIAAPAPAAIATVADTVDDLVARAAEGGVDVDERLRATLGLAEALTRPEVTRALGRVVERVDRLDALLDAADAAPGLLAGAVDTADGAIARLRERGVDVDDRLRVALDLAERLSRPETARQLERTLDLAEQAPGALAGAVDTLDGLMARLQERGVDPHARAREGLELVERLSRPEALANLRQLLDLAEQAPAGVSMLVDTVDGFMARLQDRGVDPHERLRMLSHAAEVLTRPSMLELVQAVLDRHEDIERLIRVLLDSGIFEAQAVAVVGSAGDALAHSRQEPLQPVGPWAAMRSLRDPDVGRALAFGLRFARRFGRVITGGGPASA